MTFPVVIFMKIVGNIELFLANEFSPMDGEGVLHSDLEFLIR